MLQKRWENTGDVESLFLFSLDSHSKQVGDEGDLSADVSFAHLPDLSLANHVHHLIPMPRSPSRFNRKEAHPWLDEPFEEAMILFDEVVEIVDQDVSSTLSGKIPLALSSAMAFG